MANGTRNVTLILVLFIGAAVGWFIGCSQPVPTPPPQPTPVPTAPAPTPVPTPRPFVTPPGPYPHAQNWNLTVGPTACDVTQNGQKVDVAVISKKELHWIRFTPKPKQTLSIVFHVPPTSQVPPTFPKPFRHMVLAGYDSEGYALWALVCDEHDSSCFTGPAERDASETYYKYDQILGGKLCDAGIIIQP